MSNKTSTGQKTSTKLFVNGVLILTVSNILVKVIGLLFKIPLHGYLGDEGMGYFNAAYTIYTAFFMISTAGLPVAISYMVSRSRAAGNFNQVKKIFRLAFWLFFIIGSAGMLALFFGADFFANTVAELPQSKYCIMAIAPTPRPMAVAARATPSEALAPAMIIDSTSRPKWSVPSRCAAEGGSIRRPMSWAAGS